MKTILRILLLTGWFIQIARSVSAQQVEAGTSFNQLFRRPCGGWIAGDATYSIHLPDNRTVFLMGDSFIGEVVNTDDIASGAKMIRNCALVLEGDTLRSLYKGTYENPSDFISTDNPDSTWYWPEHGLVEDGILKIFLAKYITDPNGTPGWNFVYLGHDVACFSLPEIALVKVTTLSRSHLNNVMYGNSVLQNNGYYYIYGRKDDTISGFKIPYPHLARVTDSINGNWEYFDGNQWSNDPFSTESINNFQVSQQYSVFKHEDKYVLITQDIWLSPKIYSFTSHTPYGPWENKTLLYSTPVPYNGAYTYNAFAHPQFDKDNTLLISYNTNGNLSDIISNVEIYRPVFVRVPYELIDPEFSKSKVNPLFDYDMQELNIYPNPASGHIMLNIGLVNNSQAIFRIFNINGILEKEIVFNSQSADKRTATIDISDLPIGIYMGILKTTELYLTGRIIKVEK